MRFAVFLTEDAELDIEAIYRHVATADGVDRAEHVLTGIERTCATLAAFPNRGNVPPELTHIGVLDYRELHFTPFRIVYRIGGRNRVLVHCVLDGRRDLQTLLQQRLVR